MSGVLGGVLGLVSSLTAGSFTLLLAPGELVFDLLIGYEMHHSLLEWQINDVITFREEN